MAPRNRQIAPDAGSGRPPDGAWVGTHTNRFPRTHSYPEAIRATRRVAFEIAGLFGAARGGTGNDTAHAACHRHCPSLPALLVTADAVLPEPAGPATHIVRAALRHKLYLDIEIPSDRLLYDLAVAIVQAYACDLGHAFGFIPKPTGNIYDAKPRYELFADVREGGGSLNVNKTTVAQAFPVVAKAMTFQFGYGDGWRLWVETLALGKREPDKCYPRVVASVGKAPPQYPDADKDFDGED